ncbi:MAG: 30S ribosome-binding factor RbfA [Candidatus Aminicenantia bacterium]
MGVSRRKEKVASVIKEEISKIILWELKDPNLGFITVTDVKMSNDLKTAVVYVSVLGKFEDKEKTLSVLNKGQNYIRKSIASKLNLKYNPKLIFDLDDSIEYQDRIERILMKIKNEQRNSEKDFRSNKK